MIEHLERRTAHAIANHPIPPITEPLGRNWEQPEREDITVDEEYALMTLRSFEELAEYSSTYPTGAYEGKMWKRHNGIYDHAFRARGGKPEWLLCWFGPSPKGPGWVQANRRKIILSDANIDEQE